MRGCTSAPIKSESRVKLRWRRTAPRSTRTRRISAPIAATSVPTSGILLPTRSTCEPMSATSGRTGRTCARTAGICGRMGRPCMAPPGRSAQRGAHSSMQTLSLRARRPCSRRARWQTAQRKIAGRPKPSRPRTRRGTTGSGSAPRAPHARACGAFQASQPSALKVRSKLLSASGSTGLVMCSSKPALRARTRSSSCPHPVSAMSFGGLEPARRRRSRASS